MSMRGASPNAVLQEMANGAVVARCLQVVAGLGVADALGDEPQTAATLAATTGANADALHRMLRVLAAAGVFDDRLDAGFAHNELSRALRSDHPESARAFVRMIGGPPNWDAFRELEHTARTGETAVDRVVEGGLWNFYAQNPEIGTLFNQAMTAKAHGDIAAILPAYDFSGFKTIADIAGGHGQLLRAILKATPAARGVLFDQPQVAAEAKSLGMDRVEFVSGNFFKDSPPPCDAYILMNIIHDWADPESIAILSALRRSAPANARLLIIETILPETTGPHLAKVLDIVMLVVTGGRERTRGEYASLLTKTGFHLTRVIDTRSPYSIVEAVPV
jgi:hypothetical protein